MDMDSQRQLWTTHKKESGVVLPIALIMLVIISFAGLLAARNSASYEQFSNNMRTNQVARQSAEAALRYCERVAIDQVENEGVNYATDAGKIVSTTLTSDASISNGAWNTKVNWKDAAANLIEVTLDPGSNVSDAAKSKYATNPPTCIIQPLINDRFLITVRGLSNDASVDSDGVLESGSEVWLQSILTSGVPIKSASGGNE
jgi:Tfp pilus assembly protein PilX